MIFTCFDALSWMIDACVRGVEEDVDVVGLGETTQTSFKETRFAILSNACCFE